MKLWVRGAAEVQKERPTLPPLSPPLHHYSKVIRKCREIQRGLYGAVEFLGASQIIIVKISVLLSILTSHICWCDSSSITWVTPGKVPYRFWGWGSKHFWWAIFIQSGLQSIIVPCLVYVKHYMMASEWVLPHILVLIKSTHCKSATLMNILLPLFSIDSGEDLWNCHSCNKTWMSGFFIRGRKKYIHRSRKRTSEVIKFIHSYFTNNDTGAQRSFAPSLAANSFLSSSCAFRNANSLSSKWRQTPCFSLRDL